MLPGLNYTKRCRKFRLLDKVFINIDDKKNRHIFSENGIKNINDDYMHKNCFFK